MKTGLLNDYMHKALWGVDDLSWVEKIERVIRGIARPRHTGEYKYARLQVIRLSAWAAGFLTPLLLILLMMLMVRQPRREPIPETVEVRIGPLPAPGELPEFGDIPHETVSAEATARTEAPETDDRKQVAQGIERITNIVETACAAAGEGRPETRISEEEATPIPDNNPPKYKFSEAERAIMPRRIRGVYGCRDPGNRGRGLAAYGGNSDTERAVMRALRWLKQCQEQDGSWILDHWTTSKSVNEGATALTGLALLTFLAHGETPMSKEFGKTVEKAIFFLLADQHDNGRFASVKPDRAYGIPIAGYALTEAYSVTRARRVKQGAEKTLSLIIAQQLPSGGWRYKLRKGGAYGRGSDLSYSGWCIQALVAARAARLQPETVNRALDRARTMVERHAMSSGRFCYRHVEEKSYSRLTGVGVLSLQFMRRGRGATARNGLAWLNKHATRRWKDMRGYAISDWYYTTQAMFHAGSKSWTDWNRVFSRQLVKSQVVLKGAGVNGEDIGYWDPPWFERMQGEVYNTTMCTMMLEVYYRYLPTFAQGALGSE